MEDQPVMQSNSMCDILYGVCKRISASVTDQLLNDIFDNSTALDKIDDSVVVT